MSAFLTAAVGAALLIPSAPASTAAEPSVAQGLVGKWTLNKDQSEDARAKMLEAGSRQGGGAGFGGGLGGGMQADGGRSGTLRSFFEPPETLTIDRNGDEVAVNDGERIVILHPDGRKTKTDDGRTEITAQWRGQELFVESRTERGTIASSYMVVPAKRQLYVTSRIEGRSGEPITARRVYDASVDE